LPPGITIRGRKLRTFVGNTTALKAHSILGLGHISKRKNKYGTVRLKDLQLAHDRIRKLENEFEVLYNSSFFKLLRVKDKKQKIDAQYGKYSVRELCGAFSLPTDIYYNHCIYRNNFKSEVEFKKRARLLHLLLQQQTRAALFEISLTGAI
jgi:hypothetical protein